MRGLGRALGLATLLVAVACEELGNPDVTAQRTPPIEWSEGPIRLVTRSLSVPPSRSNELLRAIAPATPHYLDFFAPKGGVVTLVIVTPELRGVPRVPTLPLVTEFRLRDGTIVRREWSAPSRAPVFYGGFGLPTAPTHAVTVIAR